MLMSHRVQPPALLCQQKSVWSLFWPKRAGTRKRSINIGMVSDEMKQGVNDEMNISHCWPALPEVADLQDLGERNTVFPSPPQTSPSEPQSCLL